MKIVLALLFLVGCAGLPDSGRNGCLIDAIALRDAIKAREAFKGARWVRVLFIKTGELGHAVCVFEHDGVFYAKDRNGARKLTQERRAMSDPLWLASLYVHQPTWAQFSK